MLHVILIVGNRWCRSFVSDRHFNFVVTATWGYRNANNYWILKPLSEDIFHVISSHDVFRHFIDHAMVLNVIQKFSQIEAFNCCDCRNFCKPVAVEVVCKPVAVTLLVQATNLKLLLTNKTHVPSVSKMQLPRKHSKRSRLKIINGFE